MDEPVDNLIVEDTLAAAEEQLLYQANLLQHVSDAVIATDLNFNITSWNHAAAALYGWHAAEVVGRPVNDIVQTTYADDRPQQVRRRFLEQGIWKGEAIQKHKNGATIHVQASVALIKDSAGQPVGAVAINRDVTERKQAEATLKKREAQLQEAQRLANLGSWEWDVATDTVTWSDELYHIFGVNPQTFGATFEHVRRLIHPDDREAFDTLIQRAFQEHGPYIFEHRIIRPDGTVRVLQSRGAVVVDEAGRVVRMFGTGQDVTERKQAETALQASEARLAGIIESALDAVISVDAGQRIVLFNAAAEKMFGYPAAEVLGQPLARLLPPRFRTAHQEHIHAFGRTGVTNRAMGHLGVITGLRANGEEFPLEASISQIEVGGARLYTAILRDVTERQRQQREMEAIAAIAMALRAAPNRAEMLPIIVRQTFNLLQADGAALATCEPATNESVIDYGYGLWADWTGRRILPGAGIGRYIVTTGQPYVSNDAGSDPRVAWLVLGGGRRAFACVPLMVQDQTMGALLVSRQSAIAEEEVGLLLAISDIAANALQRAQVVETLEQRVARRTRELAQANERLAELDRLKSKFVSDVSHELRTPVTSLKLYADLLQRSPPEKHNHYIAVIREQAGRQAQLIEDILDISRLELAADRIQFKPVALNTLVSQVVAAHQPTAEAAGLALTFTPDPDLPPVRGEVNQLAQVVTNLIANGLNYTSAGAVQVSTRLNEQVAFVEVQDTGMGIEPEDMPHLFARFYRGAQARNVPGTGLGLAIVKEIVDLHGGQIDVHSQVGIGSTFRVNLPIAT